MRAAGPDRWLGGCGCATGYRMNPFTAKVLEAADLLALARLDDDGAPSSGGLPRPQRARPVPDTIEGSSTDARGRGALRGPGQAEVSAPRTSRWCTRYLR